MLRPKARQYNSAISENVSLHEITCGNALIHAHKVCLIVACTDNLCAVRGYSYEQLNPRQRRLWINCADSLTVLQVHAYSA